MIDFFNVKDIKLSENCTYQNYEKKYQIFREIPNYSPTSFELTSLHNSLNFNKNISLKNRNCNYQIFIILPLKES